MKKYFIRKTHRDVLQEQNNLIEKLLSQHKETVVQAMEQPVDFENAADVIPPVTEMPDFDFDDDDGMFIPMIPSSHTSLNVESKKVDMDMGSVDKLKKVRKKKEAQK